MRKSLFTILFCAVAISGFAQKFSQISGNLKALKGEKQFVIAFDYSNMNVGKMTEQEYLDKKSAESEAKEPGKGALFIKNWQNARKERFEPSFIELFNKVGEDHTAHADKSNPDAKYLITVRTTFTEPGFNIGIMRQPAYINVEYTFTAISDPSKPIAVIQSTRIPGRDAMGYDFDAAYRIQEGYSKGGKSLAVYLAKQIWK